MAYWLDEGWHGWPEVVRVGTAAAGLYARCGSYIADHVTDGFIPSGVARMYGTAEWCKRLVEAGLWRTEGDGYRDTRYFPLNPSGEVIAKRKEDAAERQRRKRNAEQTRESRVTTPVTSPLVRRPRAPRPPSGGSAGAPAYPRGGRATTQPPPSSNGEPTEQAKAKIRSTLAAARRERARPAAEPTLERLRELTPEVPVFIEPEPVAVPPKGGWPQPKVDANA